MTPSSINSVIFPSKFSSMYLYFLLTYLSGSLLSIVFFPHLMNLVKAFASCSLCLLRHRAENPLVLELSHTISRKHSATWSLGQSPSRALPGRPVGFFSHLLHTGYLSTAPKSPATQVLPRGLPLLSTNPCSSYREEKAFLLSWQFFF